MLGITGVVESVGVVNVNCRELFVSPMTVDGADEDHVGDHVSRSRRR